MHHALQIQEILLNIFGHCRLPSWNSPGSDLPALARTCRTFKEPALDVLWGDLIDPSSLAKCLPEASHYQIQKVSRWGPEAKRYSFNRPLTQIECGILRSYARRVLSLVDCRHELDWGSVRTFLNPSSTDPLFPTLCRLQTGSSAEIKDLLCMPFPALTSLNVNFNFIDDENFHVLQHSLESIFMFSPNVKALFLDAVSPRPTFINFFSSHLCQWKHLQIVYCDIPLELCAFAHLSQLPTLIRLKFMLSTTLPNQITPSDTPLSFSNLQHLTLHSNLLDTVSQFLSRIQLPAITGIVVSSKNHLFDQSIPTLFTRIQTSGNSHNIQELELFLDPTTDLDEPVDIPEDLKPILGPEILQPCIAFNNLCCIEINIPWNISLEDNELLTLASAWPHLQSLCINETHGWGHGLGGISPSGLLWLLQICRSLRDIALVINPFNDTKLSSPLLNPGLRLLPNSYINVVDSYIEYEHVQAMAAFFAGLVHSPVYFTAYDSAAMDDMETRGLWRSVFELVKKAVYQRSGLALVSFT